MKLRIFESDHGDCVLLQSADGKNILCDGGMASSMREHVRGRLNTLVGTEGKLDYVYVSHIDQDHISGVLQLLQDALDWKVYDHHQAKGDTGVKKPKFPRPPAIGGLWHNAFRDQVSKNAGSIEKMLAASAPVYFGTGIPQLRRLGEEALEIATSIPEALKVSRLIKPDLLDIPLNKIPGEDGPAKLLYFRKEPLSFPVGGLKITIVGPSEKRIRELRNGWNNWLRENKTRVKAIRAEMKRRVEEFSSGSLDSTPFDLRKWNGIPDFEGVTTPNVASLMLMVEENGRRVLLTGDSQQDLILEGLDDNGFLDEGHLHLDVLKVQHHGSEYNMDANFCQKVSADHYVFCGNGDFGNPEPEVLDWIFQSRMSNDPKKTTLAPEAADRKFTFWFSTTAERQTEGGEARRNFEETERLVEKMIADSDGRMQARFNRSDYSTLSL